MELFNRVKERYQSWKDQRFLKKHGCVSWDQYHFRFDPDVNSRATRVADYYHGYPFVFCAEASNHYAYQLLADYGPGGTIYGYHNIVDWCKANTKQKHRTDILRVFKQHGLSHNPSNNTMDWIETPEWWINEIGGSDLLFFAFKSEKEYNWFMLRWAS